MLTEIESKKLSFDSIYKNLMELLQIDLNNDVKNTILRYNIRERESNYENYYKKFYAALNLNNKMAYCTKEQLTNSNYNGIQMWYLELSNDKSEYIFKTKIFTGVDTRPKNIIDVKKNNEDGSYDKFVDDLLSVFSEKHGNYVWSISFSGEAKFAGYSFDMMGVTSCDDLKDFSANGGGFVEGGIAWDEWCVGLYGNIGAFLNWQYSTVRGYIENKNLTTYKTVESMENECFSLTFGASVNVSWFWKFESLIDLYGLGHAKSLGIGNWGGTLFYNSDAES